MPNFAFVYHGGSRPETQEAGEKAMAEWRAWFEGMGGAVVDPGNPVGMSRTVTDKGVSDNGGANPVSGYSIVTAADMDAALGMAKGCPMVKDSSGSVEVAEILPM